MIFQYVVECHAQTLLPQYLGMYRLTVNDVETYMVVMRNVFSPRLPIHKKYDLKVSWNQAPPGTSVRAVKDTLLPRYLTHCLVHLKWICDFVRLIVFLHHHRSFRQHFPDELC